MSFECTKPATLCTRCGLDGTKDRLACGGEYDPQKCMVKGYKPSCRVGRSQFDLSLSYAPPALLALAPPDVLTVLILVNPAQTGPQSRQGDYAREMAAFDPPSAHFCGSDGPSFAETNACQAVSHARCSASSARPMPTAIGSSARRRLCLLRTTRPSLSRATSGVHRQPPPDPTVPAEQSAGSDSPQRRQGEQTEEAVKAKPVDQGAVFDIYRYDTGIWGFIDSFRVVLVNGMRKWYASY